MNASATWVERLARSVVAFARSRKGGAMLIGGSLAMLTMTSVGGMLSNHGWREAQREEIDAALRASVAASAHFMRGDLNTVGDKIKERVANFLRGLLGDVTIDTGDVAVEHDFTTNRTTIRIQGSATFGFRNLWGGGGGGQVEESLAGEYVIVAYDVSQYEFALALDVSVSMGNKPAGWTATKLATLKSAIDTIAQTVDDLSTTNPGLITLSLVPFANVVNVADTSGTSQTDAKERYVRMLTGAKYSTQTSRDTEEHWVDTFHSYGTGDDMGPLASRNLPDFLVTTDWNLHKSGTADVTAQAPTVGTWSFEGEDFWNGCVMARWGAYWDTAARPTVWDPSSASNWPAKKTVAGWAPGAASISDLPLHLSDAPPDASDPNTRFTAYSWPDGRINGFADSILNHVLHKTVDSSYNATFWANKAATSENHWHLRATDRGGSLYCPEAPIVPLTDDLTALQAAGTYAVVKGHSADLGGGGQTFLHLGIVWGLRTLSPLWRDVWDTTSGGDDLPRTPCREGGSLQNCSQFLQKAILIISDGANHFGAPGRGRRFGMLDPAAAVTVNQDYLNPRCAVDFDNLSWLYPDYHTAMTAEDAATFDDSFDVKANGAFSATGMSAVLDAFQAFHPTVSALDPMNPVQNLVINTHRSLWENALDDMTPWQLFRGYDDDSPTKATDATDVLANSANNFGLKGRPAQNGHFCRPMTPFSAYGRAEDLVRVGDVQPVADVAPFSVPSWKVSDSPSNLRSTVTDRLDDWFREACDIAGQRGVRIHAIFIGNNTTPSEKAAIRLLEDCVDRGYGGNASKDEVHVAPTAQQLKDTVEDIIDIRRTLRFIGP